VHHGKSSEARRCFAGLLASPDPFLRAEGYWGLERYEDANNEFRAAQREHPKSAQVDAEWGRLFLMRFNKAEAANLFVDAIGVDPNYAPAYLGLARVASQSYEKKAVEFAHQALQHDPKLVEAQELLAYLALEDNDPQLATQEAHKALTISSEALDAMAVLASIDWLNDNPQSPWITRILQINPVYGEAYATGAHFFVINRRYDDGIRLYRKAIELNPRLWEARSQLGINLMRLASNDEAKRQLEQAYAAGYRNAETVNSLRLLDSLKNYDTFRDAKSVVVLEKREADLLRPYIQLELEQAIDAYAKKYKTALSGPVRLEVYPNHDDFVVRTLGLPGQGGLLGVTFGTTVAMDSPSARPPGGFNWGSTLWHELSHVYVLRMTQHRVPRWFTEGLAVHEESAKQRDWGDRMTPEIVKALQKKQLLPVLELDRGFVRPEYPAQVIVSYFEAGKICDYIAQKWGDEALLGMIHSYAARKTTTDAIRENLHLEPQALDHEFSAWLEGQTRRTVEHLDDWKKRLDQSHAALQAGKRDEALQTGLAIRDEYSDYVGGGSVYELLADAYMAGGDKRAAAAQLEAYREKGGTNPGALKKLAALEAESGDAKAAEYTLGKLIYIYPGDEELHRKLGALHLKNGNANGAIIEYRALLALHPSDTAQSHFDLAQALEAAGKNNEAKDEVLTALEAAPDFKPAQRLLLELNK
jgi:tetratricopeptide (TPR) repeat protein